MTSAATSAANPFRRRVLPRVRPPAEMTTAMTAEKYKFGGAVLHEVRPYDGGKRRNKHRPMLGQGIVPRPKLFIQLLLLQFFHMRYIVQLHLYIRGLSKHFPLTFFHLPYIHLSMQYPCHTCHLSLAFYNRKKCLYSYRQYEISIHAFLTHHWNYDVKEICIRTFD